MKEITTGELDDLFDAGEDITPYLDRENAAMCSNDRENAAMCSNEKARISIALPEWLMFRLDEEADRRAISRSAMINVILVDWVDNELERRKLGDGPAAA